MYPQLLTGFGLGLIGVIGIAWLLTSSRRQLTMHDNSSNRKRSYEKEWRYAEPSSSNGSAESRESRVSSNCLLCCKAVENTDKCYLDCGHVMHKACYEIHGNRCPTCKLIGNCPICLYYMNTNDVDIEFLPCGHALHSMCLKEYINYSSETCPTCRQKF